MTFFYRKLNNKKGFTLTETLVVIGIIAIIGGIGVPWLMSAKNPVSEANEKARDFYFTLQNEVVELKLNGTAASDGFLVVAFDSGGTFSVSSSENDIANKLRNKLEKFYTNADRTGYYFGFVDKNFRVIRAYWSADNVSSEINSDGTAITENRTTSNILVGTFPYL